MAVIWRGNTDDNKSNSLSNVLLRVGVNTFHESGGVGVWPIGMLGLKTSADFFPGVVGRLTLTLQRESSPADF
jgi:hypothetical protein